MALNDRQKKLLRIMQEERKVLVGDLARALDVTEASIRLDLNHLETMDLVRRFHGGARLVHPSAFETRAAAGRQAKKKIARRALDYVEPKETLFLDSGSTVLMLAQELIAFDDLTVVTNSLPIANQIGREQNNRVILAGGAYNYSEQCCEGLMTEKFLDNLYASKAFIGADSIDVKKGLFSNGITGFGYVQKIIDNSKATILLVDSSKFDAVGTVKFCELERIDVIVTDDGIPPGRREEIEARGIKLAVV
jgi:DeoR/GlpR family transcriptional regulator of sugar metabolism